VVLRLYHTRISTRRCSKALWRVFKIIEEFPAASADAMEKYEDEFDKLRRENRVLNRRLRVGAEDEDTDVEANGGGYDEGDHNE
jgi:hypothetical protein